DKGISRNLPDLLLQLPLHSVTDSRTTRHIQDQQAVHEYMSKYVGRAYHTPRWENSDANTESRRALRPVPTNGVHYQDDLPSIHKPNSHLPVSLLLSLHQYDEYSYSPYPTSRRPPNLQRLQSVTMLLRYHVHKIL